MKCFICKKELKREDAYILPYTNCSGRSYKRYYCSEEEYNKYMKEREEKLSLVKKIIEISGCCSSDALIQKEIKILHETKRYSYKEILDTALNNGEYIKQRIEKNDITDVWCRIRYIFVTIKNILESSNK